MQRSAFRLLLFCLTVVGLASTSHAADGDRAPSKIGSALARRLEAHPEDRVAVWVFFADRAGTERDPSALARARQSLSTRSLDRRARRAGLTDPLESDLPVHDVYVAALRARGARLRGVSRWLNAASVEVLPREAIELAQLPFVARVDLVPIGRRITPVGGPRAEPGVRGARSTASRESGVGIERVAAVPGDPAYYGASYRQLALEQIPQLHAAGLSGASVLVCILDTGFRLTHRAYSGLSVLATRDFIHGDSNVDNEPAQDLPGQNTHGTMTLSCVAGSEPTVYSGAAFGATVALAKTEDNASETPVEMDYWQFAAEWADSLGADVISSSLGYSTFDDSGDSYSYADMDGHTTVVTLAAAEAARRGIVVVTAAGNEGARPWHYIIAPGDADTVITAGAVDSFNTVAWFSSRGPTADGRIKPDVSAMGVDVLVATPDDDSTFVRVNGTSFATPLTAGIAALLLQAHPTWGPFEVREALRETALNHATPNHDVGWGLIQAVAARSWVPSTAGVGPGPLASGQIELSAGPNPLQAGKGAVIHFAAPPTDRASVEVLDLAGRHAAQLFDGIASVPRTLSWNGRGDDGSALAAGIYWVRVTTRSLAGSRSRALRLVLLD